MITINKTLISDYKKFLDNGKTEREWVTQIVSIAEANGYKSIDKCKTLKKGDKVYITKMGKAVALFQIGSGKLEDGMNILGAHIDSPRLDVKQKPLYEKDTITYLNTHYYGGIKKYQWLTIPLAIHGVVVKKDGTTVNVSIGEKDTDPVFCITDILPHLAQEQYKKSAAEFIPGEDLDLVVGNYGRSNIQFDMKEKKETAKASDKPEKELSKTRIVELLKKTCNFTEKDFESAELEIVPAGHARDNGLDRSMILAYGQDDRSCAYTSFAALMDTTAKERTTCCLCVDKEEIGSAGATGMASNLFENMVAEIVSRTEKNYSELTLRRCLANSNMLSSDVNAAFDPLHPGLYDRDNSSWLGGGIVFQKYTGARGKSGASDANPEFIAKVCSALDKKNIIYQMAELGKVDQGGGGTIAHYAARYGMNVLDAGVAVLSMHAPWELTSKVDICQAYEAYKAFLTIK